MKGTVEKACAHYYGGDDVAFPPRGCPVLEVACFSQQISEKDVGFVERENNDVLFLAFFMNMSDVQNDEEQFAKMKEADLNASDMDAACRIIAGTARSMGIEVE